MIAKIIGCMKCNISMVGAWKNIFFFPRYLLAFLGHLPNSQCMCVFWWSLLFENKRKIDAIRLTKNVSKWKAVYIFFLDRRQWQGDIILAFYFKFLIKSIGKCYQSHTYTQSFYRKFAYRINVAKFFFPDYLQ